MKNCNWWTKLRTNKTFIKGIKSKIKNQKNKEWNWKPKNKKDNHVPFQVRERKERGGERNDYWLQSVHHSSSHTTPWGRGCGGAFKDRMNGKFGQQVDSYMSKWYRCHPFTSM